MDRIVLASASPRRRELLSLLGVAFEVKPADVDETPWPGEAALDYVIRVAEDKANVAAARDPGALIIAADTTVDLDGAILAKPADEAEAERMLRALSGRAHEVHTHVVVTNGADGWGMAATVTTQVLFDVLSEGDIVAYVATGEPMDKAGAYAIQGGAAAFVRAVHGSVTNVVGLPLAELRELLRDAELRDQRP